MYKYLLKIYKYKYIYILIPSLIWFNRLYHCTQMTLKLYDLKENIIRGWWVIAMTIYGVALINIK